MADPRYRLDGKARLRPGRGPGWPVATLTDRDGEIIRTWSGGLATPAGGAVTLLPRTGPRFAPLPLPQERTPANTVPEPGTLALIGAGLAGIVWRSRP